jgi:hypothetical protein
MAQAIRDHDITPIYASEALWSMWRASPKGESSALALEWTRQYPMLFDQDDLDLIVNQAFKGYHFAERFAAIHLFIRNGARSVIEKYDTYENHFRARHQHVHPEKMALYVGAVSEEHRAIHHEICSKWRVQLPDLWCSPQMAPMVSPRSRDQRTAPSIARIRSAYAPTFERDWESASRSSASFSFRRSAAGRIPKSTPAQHQAVPLRPDPARKWRTG